MSQEANLKSGCTSKMKPRIKKEMGMVPNNLFTCSRLTMEIMAVKH